ncbi:hypothetical protein ASG87_10195 [Frateuria sp. Soil773]|uniref:SRPBCC family protein n=1 Tax=Frateuria sp. Soil773 TaxID=1736407 RepID=UPI0006F326B9|nr:SRPBCC domain-containing protein [Frateuria sp. Soil773]KRF01869.1 hypothetical protein ASG87_10195 [Frateuria sp. Soil773]
MGGSIVVRGIRHARSGNNGTVREFEPVARLAYTHRSSLSRLPDEPGSYTTLAFGLEPAGDAASLTLAATGFPTEAVFRHLKFYWGGALECLKRQAERRASRRSDARAMA